MSSTGRLLVIERGVKLNGDAYDALKEAGYIIVRGEPSKFHTFGDQAMTQEDGEILDCALRAFQRYPASNATSAFGEELAKLAAAKRRNRAAGAPGRADD